MTRHAGPALSNSRGRVIFQGLASPGGIIPLALMFTTFLCVPFIGQLSLCNYISTLLSWNEYQIITLSPSTF